MPDPLLQPELREMLLADDAPAFREFCEIFHPSVVAENLEPLSDAEVWRILTTAPLRRQVEILPFFTLARQRDLVNCVDQQHLSALIEAMAPDDRVALLKTMEPGQVERLLPLMAQAERSDIRRLLSYPDQSAGSLMTTEYASLRENVAVRDALNQLRTQAPDRETIYSVYVLDDDRHLHGQVSLRKLILAKPETLVSEIMERNVISVRVDEDRQAAARKIARYDFLAVPVVDDQQRLVGIITHDDVLDLLQREATEDVQRLGGVEPLLDDYLHIPFLSLWRKRAVWLSFLFLAEIFTFSALSHYEDAIQSVVVLGLFVPLCISTGGNSGSQAATLVTRAMALGQVAPRDWLRVIRHELLMGIALGITLGGIGFVRAALTSQSVLGDASRWTMALVISQSVAAICLWGTLVGSILPLIFKRVGVDPGVASSPFVATFVDVTGIVIYFSIAKAYLL